MRAALIGAVDFNGEHFASQEFDYVVAVDGGWQACCDAHIAPNVAIGDFDSLGFVPEGVPVVEFPSIKDESDMELALRHVVEKGADEAVLYGGLSGRLDHTLANLALLAHFAREGVKVAGVGDDFATLALAAGEGSSATTPDTVRFSAFDPAQLGGSYAPYLSVFATIPSLVDIAGLAYEVESFTLLPDTSRGLSNHFVGADARIVVRSGAVLVTLPLDALGHAVY